MMPVSGKEPHCWITENYGAIRKTCLYLNDPQRLVRHSLRGDAIYDLDMCELYSFTSLLKLVTVLEKDLPT